MKVSVIIPVYNAEKYLGVCLESILIQTLQDYEVIIVNDCSTDKSCAVAESYLEKFGGRLKIISLNENTGSGAVPRNVGLDYARGKYVFFMDADDLFIDIALETLYYFAEEYQTDVIYMEQGFVCGKETVPQNFSEVSWNPPKFLSSAPTFEPENFSERIQRFLKLAIGVPPWEKFLRRNFLIENKITFPELVISEDTVWTFKIVCLAKRLLRLPTALYVQRENFSSMLRKNRSPEQEIILWGNPLINGLDCLSEFMDGIEFFRQNPAYQFAVLNFFAKMQLDFMAEAFKKLDPHAVYKIFLEELSASKINHDALIAYLLTTNNLYRNELIK